MKKREVLLRIMTMLKKFWKEGLLATALIAAELAFRTIGPLFSKGLIDQALPEKNMKMLAVLVILYFSFMLFEGVMNYLNVRIFSAINKKVFINIRTALFRHLQKLSIKFFSQKKSGELLMRLCYDVDNLENLSMGAFLNMVKNIVLTVAIFVLMFMLNRVIGLYTLIMLPLFLALINVTGGMVYGVADKFQQAKESLTGNFQENISGMKMIKTYNLESYYRGKIEKEIRETEELKRRHDIANCSSAMSGHALLLVVSAIMWGIGSFEIVNGKLTIGGFFAIITYFQLLTTPISELLSGIMMMQGSLSSANRIFELMKQESEGGDDEALPNISLSEGRICFENVSLSYESRENILEGLNLTIEPGEVTALIGHSGAGKTSLINLIMVFLKPTSGEIFVDGQRLSEVKGSSMRDNIALVSQDTFLFNSTIRENITLGNSSISDDEIDRVAKMLRLDQYIEEMPDGYDTQVGERGLQLSGGQRKLIDLCRALIRKPKILIMDEATSELDSITESIIKETLMKMAGKMTVIIISHRIATLSWVKKIAILNNGQIEAIGDHEQLIGSNELYSNLYKQFTYEEHKLLKV